MATHMEYKLKYKEKKSAKEEKYDKCRQRLFLAFNWLGVLIITFLSFFTGVTQTTSSNWDMSQHCNDEKFNQQASPISKKLPATTIILLTMATSLIMSSKMLMLGKVTQDILHIVNFLTGLLLSWDVTYIIQNMLSYPIPSYFTNKDLEMYYCCKSCPPQKLTTKLEALDLGARGSFPSFLMCALLYTTVYFHLFVCYLDTRKNFILRLTSVLVPGFVCLGYGWLLWKHNENHLEDIIGGCCIGIFLAIYGMKNSPTKNNKFSRLTDDFISVLVIKQNESSQQESTEDRPETESANEYTVSLCSEATTQLSPNDDLPPSYSSIQISN